MAGSKKQPATKFGTQLSEMLRSRSMSQADLSGEIGFSTAYMSALALGTKNASAQMADKVADALGADAEDRLRLHRAAAEDAGFRLDLPEDF